MHVPAQHFRSYKSFLYIHEGGGLKWRAAGLLFVFKLIKARSSRISPSRNWLTLSYLIIAANLITHAKKLVCLVTASADLNPSWWSGDTQTPVAGVHLSYSTIKMLFRGFLCVVCTSQLLLLRNHFFLITLFLKGDSGVSSRLQIQTDCRNSCDLSLGGHKFQKQQQQNRLKKCGRQLCCCLSRWVCEARDG